MLNIKHNQTDAQFISDLLRSRQPGYTLPAPLYTSKAAFEADCQAIFMQHWIAVGVECDVEAPGDVIALDIGPTSILILRDDDMQIRAFHNICSHRGARLVPLGRSIVGKLVCPYHQWTYDLDGTLSLAPHMGIDFARDLHHLKPISLRSVGGILYVCLSDDPPDDIEVLADVVGQRLAPYDLTNTRIAYESEVIERGNWKLSIENNRECYHCAANHPELTISFHAADFGFDPEGLGSNERKEADQLAQAYIDQGMIWDQQGLDHEPINHTLGQATNFRTQRLIIAGSGESQTIDTRAACLIPLGQMNMSGSGDVHLWGINSWNHIMADHAVIFSIFPLAADKTLLRTKWLVHKDAIEGRDYNLEHLTSVWKATNAQDAGLVEMAHKGVSSSAYTPGPYSPYTERALDDFTTWYIERMIACGYGA